MNKTLIKKDLQANWSLYLMILPVVAFYIIFCYVPMGGAIIAFKDYSPALGILESPWIGFEQFERFFGSRYFWTLLKNTLRISIANIIFGFSAPIVFAVLLNEIGSKYFVKTVQTITYIPHFISVVIICALVREFVSADGLVNIIAHKLFGIKQEDLLTNGNAFTSIYVISEMWQNMGWDSIIYFAAIAGINAELYEAAKIDGAGRIRRIFSITLPSLMPTIIVLFILRIGATMSLGFEKIILLYNPMIYNKADVISTFIYRAGLYDNDYGYSTAIGLFNSIINFLLVYSANNISKRVNKVSLW